MCPLWLSAALSLNAVFTVEDFLNAVPKIQQLLRTVVDPDQSPAGSELARLHAVGTPVGTPMRGRRSDVS